MANFESLTVRFVRKTSKVNKDTDDILTITPCWNTTDAEVQVKEYNVKMLYAGESMQQHNPRTSITTMQGYDIVPYVRSVLRLIQNDFEPFVNVQFDIPMMPSVIYDTDDLDDSMEDIVQMLEIVLRCWPKMLAPATPKKPITGVTEAPPPVRRIWEMPLPMPKHLIFDSDGEETHRDLSVLDHP